MTTSTFGDLDLDDDLVRHLARLGYTEPTAVQARAIAPLLEGRDAAIEAPTGTGKTLAFGLPLIVRAGVTALGALVLVPTRELAAQVARDLQSAGAPSGFSARAFTGGRDAGHDVAELKRSPPTCLVATPGRILDLLDRDTLDVSRLRILVLDEADRMLDMGFLADVERILAKLPAERQTALASATLSEAVLALASSAMREPEVVRVSDAEAGPSIAHYRVNVTRAEAKPEALLAVLKKEKPARAIVFVERRDDVVEVAKLLKSAGIVADPLHGERTQGQRRHAMELFRKGASHVLVATDVAARGLDVPEVDLIVNADAPRLVDMYLHRSGRTARFKRRGRVITLLLPTDKFFRERLRDARGIDLTPYKLDLGSREGRTPMPSAAPAAKVATKRAAKTAPPEEIPAPAGKAKSARAAKSKAPAGPANSKSARAPKSTGTSAPKKPAGSGDAPAPRARAKPTRSDDSPKGPTRRSGKRGGSRGGAPKDASERGPRAPSGKSSTPRPTRARGPLHGNTEKGVPRKSAAKGTTRGGAKGANAPRGVRPKSQGGKGGSGRQRRGTSSGRS